MKTNVIMVREMGDYKISQRTKDGMFNVTELLKQWNGVETNPKRDIKDFFKLKGTVEFLEELKNDEDVRGVDSPLYKMARGRGSSTWLHPYLFIKVSMWVNPKFELQVIKFVYDNLIAHRHKAGDNYRSLASSATVYPDTNYPMLAKALNYIVFGRHESGIRQEATQDQLLELAELEAKLIDSIEMGYIGSFKNLMNDLRKRWYKKNAKF